MNVMEERKRAENSLKILQRLQMNFVVLKKAIREEACDPVIKTGRAVRVVGYLHKQCEEILVILNKEIEIAELDKCFYGRKNGRYKHR